MIIFVSDISSIKDLDAYKNEIQKKIIIDDYLV